MRQCALRGILFSALLLFCLSSCRNEEFSLTSASLTLNDTYSVNEEGEGVLEESFLSLSLYVDTDDTYTFSLTSGPLTWEGSLTGSDLSYLAEELRLTRGSFFPSGEYSLRLVNRRGQIETTSLNLQRESFDSLPHFDSMRILVSDREVELVEGEESFTLQAGEGLNFSDVVKLRFLDNYGNGVTVLQDLTLYDRP